MSRRASRLRRAVTLRTYRDADEDCVARLFHGTRSGVGGRGAGAATLARWHAFSRRPALADNIVVAELRGRTVGVGWSMPERSFGVPSRQFRIWVGRGQRRQGVGGALLRWIDGRAGEALELQCEVPAAWRSGGEFLRRKGFHARRSMDLMRLHSRIEPACEVPPGYRLRALIEPAGADELRAWCALHDRLFADALHFQAWQPRDAQAMTRELGFGLRWAETLDGSPVGYVHTLLEADRHAEARGWIDARGVVAELGVAPEHRGRGLGRALMGSALAAWRRRGVNHSMLHVERGRLPARLLYRSLGFRTAARLYVWSRARGPRIDSGHD